MACRSILCLLLFIALRLSVNAATNWCVFLGNSITCCSYNGGYPSNWPNVATNWLGWGGINLAVSGESSSNILLSHLTGAGQAFAQSKPSVGNNFVAVFEGGNSIRFTSNNAVAYPDFTNICYRLGTNGQTNIIVCTIPPRYDLYSDTTMSNAVDEFNTNLIANYRSYAKCLIQFHTNVLLDPRIHAENFDGSKVHPINEGVMAFARQFTNDVGAYLNRGLIISNDQMVVIVGDSYSDPIQWQGYLESAYHFYYPTSHLRFRTGTWSGSSIQDWESEPFQDPIYNAPDTNAICLTETFALPFKPNVILSALGQNNITYSTNPWTTNFTFYLSNFVNLSNITLNGVTNTGVQIEPGPSPYFGGSPYTSYRPFWLGQTNAIAGLGYQIVDTFNVVSPLLQGELYQTNWTPPFTNVWKDAHPSVAGHPSCAYQLVRSYLVLRQLEFPTNISSALIDAQAGTSNVTDCLVTNLSASRSGVTFSRYDHHLPMAWDQSSDTSSWRHASWINTNAYTLCPWLQSSVRHMLVVSNLFPGSYNLKIDGSNVATLNATQLQAGFNLATLESGSYWTQRLEVLRLIRLKEGRSNEMSWISVGGVFSPAVGVYKVRQAGLTSFHAGNRGTNLFNDLADEVAEVLPYDTNIWNAAQPQWRTFSISMVDTNAIAIGSQTAVQIPTSAQYGWFRGFQPADGAVETYNPPIFSWTFWPVEQLYSISNANNQTTYRFVFQLSTNNDFTSPYWSITCSNSEFNLVQPVTNAAGAAWPGSNYWRVIYKSANLATTVSTSAVHHYKLAGSPIAWNRAMLNDDAALIAKGHPNIFFNSGNLAAVRTFVKTNTQFGFNWVNWSNAAVSYRTASWWNTNSVHEAGGINSRISAAAVVAWAYQMTGDSYWLGSGSNSLPDIAMHLGLAVLEQYMDRLKDDYEQGTGMSRSLGILYDYLYDVMDANQRSNLLYACERRALYLMRQNTYWQVNADPAGNRQYTNSPSTPHYSAMMRGSSHERDNHGGAMLLGAAGMAESAILREILKDALCHEIVIHDPMKHDEGAYSANAKQWAHSFPAMMVAHSAFPEAALTNRVALFRQAELFAYQNPILYIESPGFYNDLGAGPSHMYYDSIGVIAMAQGRGDLYQHYLRAYSVKSDRDIEYVFGGAYPGYYYGTPTQVNWTNTYLFDPEWGWCISGSYQPSDWNAFTNDIRMTFTARPSGGRGEHTHWHDGALKLTAYGANVSAQGMGQYVKNPLPFPSLFVDGIGIMNPDTHVTEATYSKFIHFTNNSDFTFVSAELGPGMNRSNFTAPGGMTTAPFYNISTNKRPYIASVRRHVLFPHKKYWVIYDTMTTTQAAQLQVRWNIPEPSSTINTNTLRADYWTTNLLYNTTVTAATNYGVTAITNTFTPITNTNLLVGFSLRVRLTNKEFGDFNQFSIGTPSSVGFVLFTNTGTADDASAVVRYADGAGTNWTVVVDYIATNSATISNAWIISTQSLDYVKMQAYTRIKQVNVAIQQIADTNNCRMLLLSDVLTNPFTHETLRGTGADRTAMPHSAFYYYNPTPAQNVHWVTVVYPRNYTNATNTIIVGKDSYTVAVTNAGDGVADVVTFDPGYAGAYTYMIDALATNQSVTSIPTFPVPGGSGFTFPTNIIINGELGCTIIYSNLTTSSGGQFTPGNSVYLAAPSTIQAMATNQGKLNSVWSAPQTYTATPTNQVNPPDITPNSQTFYPSINVTFTCSTPDASIAYVTDTNTLIPWVLVTNGVPVTFTNTIMLWAAAQKTNMISSQWTGPKTYTLGSAPSGTNRPNVRTGVLKVGSIQ